MVYCAAFGCNEGSAKGGNTSFFSFPKDATLRKRWVANMKRDCFMPAKHSRLCSLHFERSCFDRDPVFMASMGYKGARISLKAYVVSRRGTFANAIDSLVKGVDSDCDYNVNLY